MMSQIMPESPVTVAERFIALKQGRVFVKTWEPADDMHLAPILLFHDSLGCAELWRDFPVFLARRTSRTVIAYDRIGFGRSDPHSGSIGFDFVAREAEEIVPQLCTALGLGRFVACGHSVGGGMAVETAARFPDRCEALVTMAAQAFVEERTVQGIAAAGRQFRTTEALARLRRYHGEKAEWVVNAWVDTWLAPDFAAWNLDEALAKITCPILAIHGDRDEYGSVEHPARIAGERGEIRILPGAGHVLHREDPAGLAASITRFLSHAPAGALKQFQQKCETVLRPEFS